MKKYLILGNIFCLLLIFAKPFWNTSKETANTAHQQLELQKLTYNNPTAITDLDVGFKAVPMPMDFDGDGDFDLLVSASGSYAESGVFYFENISGNVDFPIFRHRMEVSSDRFRLGHDGKLFDVSVVDGHYHVLTPDNVNEQLLLYEDVPQNVFWKRTKLGIPTKDHIPNTHYNTWKMLDFDQDGLYDLMCGLSSKQKSHLLFFKNIGTKQNAKYAAPEDIKTQSGTPLADNLNLQAGLGDFDQDGDIDYISIGIYADFVYFENKGTATQHQFAADKVLQNKGEKLQMASRYGSAMTLRSFDWNQDGLIDLIVGDEDGKVSFIKNTGKQANGLPIFEQPQFFQQEARFVDLGALVAPRIYDWDGDGLEDILYGNGLGHIGFVKNISTSNRLKWAAPEILTADQKPILIIPPAAFWGYVTIDVGDWNQDDLPDILANDHNGNVVWFENTGTKRAPKLKAAQAIEVEWAGRAQRPKWQPGMGKGYEKKPIVKEKELLAPWRTSPYIMDVNGDGMKDLVMLDYEGYLVTYFRFKDSNGNLKLAHPKRNFLSFDKKQPILLNQLQKGSCGRLKIDFADWDGDGLEDLIFSSKPAVDWMKNKGQVDGHIVLEYMGRVASKTLMGHTDGPVVADINMDGVSDLVIGTETGVLYYWERPNTNITTTMTSDAPQKAANYPYFKR